MSSSGNFAQSFGLAPIILIDGIASGATGGMSIADLLGDAPDNADSAFATFVPLSGGKIIDNDVATYPFANQAIAANAIIAKGLTISMKMICPVREAGGYGTKLATITALQASLAQHVNLGGTFTVATPSFYWENGLLLTMFDVSDGESKQAQIEWQLDFYFPLLTLAQAAAAQNTLMSKVSSGTPVDGDPPACSGLSTTAGSPGSVGATGGGTVAPPASNQPVST